MKKSILTLLTGLLLSAALPVTAFAQELIVGGQAVGIRVRTEGVLVSGTAPVETAEGEASPAEAAGIQEGDRILGVNGRSLHGAAELIAAVGAGDLPRGATPAARGAAGALGGGTMDAGHVAAGRGHRHRHRHLL